MLGAALIGAGLCLGVPSHVAAGSAMRALSAPSVSTRLIEPAGWRRYCRRFDCGPVAVLPGEDVDVDVVGADVEVDVAAPVVVVLPPPRPLSCGQYRYWNGTACVDARYTDPYLGPK
jgi:hypothetical protein